MDDPFRIFELVQKVTDNPRVRITEWFIVVVVLNKQRKQSSTKHLIISSKFSF